MSSSWVAFTSYRRLFSVQGVGSLMVLMVLARVPAAAAGISLTLDVVLGMHRGYGAAGLVAGAGTMGVAIGSPLTGRLIDRHGVRPVVAICGACEVAFWFTAPLMPYQVLLPMALLTGILSLPLFSVARQALAAMVSEDLRRTAYSLDSMSVEASFAVGPAAAVLLATALSPGAALRAVGTCMGLAALGMFLLNPPTRSETEMAEQGETPPRRQWMASRGLWGVLLVSVGATIILGGTDTSLVASLRATNALNMTGVVFAAWCLSSMAGGFVHGAVRRSLPPVVLCMVLGVLTVPAGFLSVNWWLLAIAFLPAGFLCAPTLAATGEAISRAAPAAVRGEALGLHGSALTVGISLGAPLAGAVIDHTRPMWGFITVGITGAAICVAAIPLLRRAPHTTTSGVPHIEASSPAQAGPAAADPAALGLPEEPTFDRV